MLVDRKPIFAAVKQLRGGAAWTQATVDALDQAIDKATGESTARFQPASSTPAQPTAPAATAFTLSQHSKDLLAYVRPELRRCVELAISYSPTDFRVNQTLRTIEEQKVAVAAGHSRTMHSRHLKQADGWVWAVDLVALNKGEVSWQLALYADIAYAMDKAATELGLAGHVRWGCAWDRVLSDFGGDPKAYMDEVKAYEERHAGSDLLDGPHFEWVQ